MRAPFAGLPVGIARNTSVMTPDGAGGGQVADPDAGSSHPACMVLNMGCKASASEYSTRGRTPACIMRDTGPSRSKLRRRVVGLGRPIDIAAQCAKALGAAKDRDLRNGQLPLAADHVTFVGDRGRLWFSGSAAGRSSASALFFQHDFTVVTTLVRTTCLSRNGNACSFLLKTRDRTR